MTKAKLRFKNFQGSDTHKQLKIVGIKCLDPNCERLVTIPCEMWAFLSHPGKHVPKSKDDMGKLCRGGERFLEDPWIVFRCIETVKEARGGTNGKLHTGVDSAVRSLRKHKDCPLPEDIGKWAKNCRTFRFNCTVD